MISVIQMWTHALVGSHNISVIKQWYLVESRGDLYFVMKYKLFYFFFKLGVLYFCIQRTSIIPALIMYEKGNPLMDILREIILCVEMNQAIHATKKNFIYFRSSGRRIAFSSPMITKNLQDMKTYLLGITFLLHSRVNHLNEILVYSICAAGDSTGYCKRIETK
ncbi:uncharacterized protein LOC125370418 [Ricinus communis]|uniref:uncharacterized protein LOC125370418 n=1 Tax=Ricinus communis TaxID=3988 RepID=UPI00201AE0E0|nr:uncharacterized protein LOC125370418 [Ricinus communis]